MKAWIVGASGTIGGAIADRFHNEGVEVFRKKVEITDYYAISSTANAVRPDIVVNCAGVYIYGAFGGSILDWTSVIDVNLTGSFHLTRAVLPNMLAKGGGKIIHLSGGGAAYGRRLYSAYAASKAGLVRFVECVAEEVEQFNVQINCIAPGSVKSKMNPKGTETPQKAVELAMYLASPESSHVTGRLIHVNEDYRNKTVWGDEDGKLRRMPL
jgi:3-oxoacyl-[acyl-carrier protein] reductase